MSETNNSLPLEWIKIETIISNNCESLIDYKIVLGSQFSDSPIRETTFNACLRSGQREPLEGQLEIIIKAMKQAISNHRGMCRLIGAALEDQEATS